MYLQFPLFFAVYILAEALIAIPPFRDWFLESIVLQYSKTMLVLLVCWVLRRVLMETSAPKRVGLLFPREFAGWDMLLTMTYLPLGVVYTFIRMFYSCIQCPCKLRDIDDNMVPFHLDISHLAYEGTINGARLRSEYGTFRVISFIFLGLNKTYSPFFSPPSSIQFYQK